MFLEVGWVTELATTVTASETRLVGVYQHVVVERVLPCEDGLTYPALIWTDACKWGKQWMSQGEEQCYKNSDVQYVSSS